MTGEPVAGELRHAFERPWLLEQMRRAWHDLQGDLTAHLLDRLAVHLNHRHVEPAHDQQRRGRYLRQ